MGGMVALAIRQHGRTTVRLVPKWHGAAPTLGSFASGEYRKEYGFRSDWNAGTKLPLAPKHYGLVIIDYDTRWCGSCSDYGGIHESSFQLNRDYKCDDLAQLLEQGRVASLALAQSSGPDIPLEFPASGATLHDIQKAIIQAGGVPEESTLFAELSAPKGWEFEDFDPDDAEEWKKLIAAMETRSFPMPDHIALRAWDAFFEDKDFMSNPTHVWHARVQGQELDRTTVAAAPTSRRRGL